EPCVDLRKRESLEANGCSNAEHGSEDEVGNRETPRKVFFRPERGFQHVGELRVVGSAFLDDLEVWLPLPGQRLDEALESDFAHGRAEVSEFPIGPALDIRALACRRWQKRRAIREVGGDGVALPKHEVAVDQDGYTLVWVEGF